MNTAAKLSAYGAALALLITGAYVVGTAVGPLTTATAGSGDLGETPGAGSAGHGDTHSGTVAEAADQPGAEIRHDVAVQVRHHEHVELSRVHHEMHAGGVDDLLVIRDVGVLA